MKVFSIVFVVLALIALVKAFDSSETFEIETTDPSLLEFENSLEQLQQAIASGKVDESVLDEFYESADEEAEIEDSVDAEFLDLCKFKCTKGKLAPRPGHVPSANGCGAAGDGWLAKTVRKYLNKVPNAFIQCCNAHDKCYGTCHVGKDSPRKNCDKAFGSCLKGAVNSMIKIPLGVRSAAQNTCVTLGLHNVFYTAVAVLGCPAYKNAQKEACICK